MKIVVLAALLCALPAAANAQAPSCQTIPTALDRLACYDRLSPPVKPTLEQAAKNKNRAMDENMREEERVKKALRPICSNC